MDYGGVLSALLTDIPKAFDCILHELFIVKLEAYGFQTDALNLVYDYLSDRKHRVANKGNDKRFDNRGYSILLLMGIFLEHL